MANLVDAGIEKFIVRCRDVIGSVYGSQIGDKVAESLRNTFNQYKRDFSIARKELPPLLEIKEDILRSITVLPKEGQDFGGEISDELWGMLAEDKLDEIDEKNRGERGEGEPLEFKRPQ